MKVLYNGGQWIKLASKVMEIGYESNLAYFYLGRAAEGLGFDYAAFRYYGYAMRAHSCGSNCDGIAFPSELIARKDTVAKSIGARSIKAAEERAAADKVKAEADEKARAEAAHAERVAMLKAATTAAYQKGTLAVPVGYEQLVAEHFKSTGVEMPARQGPRAFPTDYRGDSIVDLVQRFESIDKLAVDEFTKTATVENRVAALAGKRFRFVFSATLNKNYLATKSGDGTQYDADGEVLRVALWSRDRRILVGRRAADNPGYTHFLIQKS